MPALGRGFSAALIVAAAGFLIVPFKILAAPIEPVMGFVQKIFYFHVPFAITMFVTTFTAAGGSVAYLFKGSERGDRLAEAASELGVVFGACVLVSGPLWGRKAWGVWWEWDVRLTSALLLELVFVAYLLVRKYGGPGAEKLAAATALFGFAVAPFVYKSVDIWRTVHPKTSVVPTLPRVMAGPLALTALAFVLLFLVLLTLRVRLAERQAMLDELYLAHED